MVFQAGDGASPEQPRQPHRGLKPVVSDKPELQGRPEGSKSPIVLYEEVSKHYLCGEWSICVKWEHVENETVW